MVINTRSKLFTSPAVAVQEEPTPVVKITQDDDATVTTMDSLDNNTIATMGSQDSDNTPVTSSSKPTIPLPPPPSATASSKPKPTTKPIASSTVVPVRFLQPAPASIPKPATAPVQPAATTPAQQRWKYAYFNKDQGLQPPEASQLLATQIFKPTFEEQEVTTAAFHRLLQNNEDLALLNTETTPVVCVMQIPTTRMLRVFLGLGSGASFGGLKGSPINNYALAIHGEYIPGVKFPSVQSFPISELTTKRKVTIPTHQWLADFNNTYGDKPLEIGKGNFCKVSDPRDTYYHMLPLAPIPAFYVFDHLDKPMDALLLLDRMMYASESDIDFKNSKCTEAMKYAVHFCSGILAKRTVKETNLTFPSQYWSGIHLNNDCELWKQQRLNQLFPTIFNPSSTVPATISTTSAPATAVPTTKVEDETKQLLLRLLAQQSSQQKQPTEAAADKYLGMSESEFERLLIWCGLTIENADRLPQHWILMAEKNLSKEGKKGHARKALSKARPYYRGAKIPITPALLTMVTTRAFEGELSSSKLDAVKGLSPFAFPARTGADLDSMNAIEDAISLATHVSTSDVSKTTTKLVEIDDYQDLMRYTKVFANVIECLFSTTSPLWRTLRDVVDELLDYSEEAAATMTRETCNAVLWIIMRQARNFAAGDMTDEDALTVEYQEMLLALTSHRSIEYGGMPSSMKLPKMGKRKAPSADPFASPQSKYGKGNSGNQERDLTSPSKHHTDKGYQHPKLATAFNEIKNQRAIPPKIYDLCKKAQCTPNELFPNHRPGLCIKSQIFGLCAQDCNHRHQRISDADADIVIKKCKGALDDPTFFKNKV
jgi:hypothetical protein